MNLCNAEEKVLRGTRDQRERGTDEKPRSLSERIHTASAGLKEILQSSFPM